MWCDYKFIVSDNYTSLLTMNRGVIIMKTVVITGGATGIGLVIAE